MKTISEFINSRKVMPFNEYEKETGSDVMDYDQLGRKLYVYDGFVYLMLNEKTGYYELNLERSFYASQDIYELECILWDWYKYELGLTRDEIEDDLHSRARVLLGLMDEDCSLDEVNMDKKPKDIKNKVSYLLKEFEY